MWTLNDLQRLPRDIFSLWTTSGITPDLMINLNKTLVGDKDLHIPRKLQADSEKELTLKRLGGYEY